MACDTKTLIEKRLKIYTEMRAAWDAANADGRQPTAEDIEAFNKADADMKRVEEQLNVELRARDIEKALKMSIGRAAAPQELRETGQGNAGREKRYSKAGRRLTEREIARNADHYQESFRHWMRRGKMALISPDDRVDPEVRAYLAGEFRALAMDSDIAGGYLVPPQEFVDELIIFVNNLVFVRALGKVLTVEGAQTLGIPSLDTDISAPVWTTEVGNLTSSLDTAMSFGKRTLTPTMAVKGILISNELLMRAASIQDLVKERLGYQFAIMMENNFFNGNGVQQPLGLFVASPQGIPTTQDVSTATPGEIDYDDLISLKYSLKEQYQRSPNLTWMMSRYTVSEIMKLVDSQNRPLWQPSLQLDQPDRLLNIPIRMSEYVPAQGSATFVTGTYAALLGDLRYYYICDVEGAEGLTIQRLDELYAATNQTGFIGRLRCDGMPVLAEAFARLKL